MSWLNPLVSGYYILSIGNVRKKRNIRDVTCRVLICRLMKTSSCAIFCVVSRIVMISTTRRQPGPRRLFRQATPGIPSWSDSNRDGSKRNLVNIGHAETPMGWNEIEWTLYKHARTNAVTESSLDKMYIGEVCQNVRGDYKEKAESKKKCTPRGIFWYKDRSQWKLPNKRWRKVPAGKHGMSSYISKWEMNEFC